MKNYCWWLKSGDHQLRLVVYPMIYRALGPSQVVVWDFWTINSIRCCHQTPSWQRIFPPLSRWFKPSETFLFGFDIFEKSFPRWRCFHPTSFVFRWDSKLSSCSVFLLLHQTNCNWLEMPIASDLGPHLDFECLFSTIRIENWVFPEGCQQQMVNVRCLLDKCLKT